MCSRMGFWRYGGLIPLFCICGVYTALEAYVGGVYPSIPSNPYLEWTLTEERSIVGTRCLRILQNAAVERRMICLLHKDVETTHRKDTLSCGRCYAHNQALVALVVFSQLKRQLRRTALLHEVTGFPQPLDWPFAPGWFKHVSTWPSMNIPIPTKIGSKMGGAPTPKWDPIGFEPRPL